MKVINYLFNKGYFPKSIHFDKVKKKIFNDPKHQEFKDALLHEVSKKMAENMELLHQPVRNLEMKGELNAIFRVYADLIETFLPEAEKAKHEYIDPIKLIEQQAKESLANRKEVL